MTTTANVSHKTVRTLHSQLKNELFQLENAIQSGQGLFDLVANSQPDELDAIKKQVAADGDKIVSRFFTYAMRLHNEKADNALLVIKKEALQRDIAELEREQRQRLGQDTSISDEKPLATSNSATKVRTVVVDRGRQEPFLRM